MFTTMFFRPHMCMYTKSNIEMHFRLFLNVVNTSQCKGNELERQSFDYNRRVKNKKRCRKLFKFSMFNIHKVVFFTM